MVKPKIKEHVETIVVDNDSTDRTKEIAEERGQRS
jgi:glycosyltransferase involved in cell wall biosynthesis